MKAIFGIRRFDSGVQNGAARDGPHLPAGLGGVGSFSLAAETDGRTMILLARWVLPIDSPPISRGAVRIVDGRITLVGREDEVVSTDSQPPIDLGNAILLPGFVNAHCHLDYTHLRTIGSDLAFPEWIRELTRRKMAIDADGFLAAARDGAVECLQSGITTVADCSDSAHAAQALSEAGLRGLACPEIFGIDDRDSIDLAIAGLEAKERRQAAWLSDRVRPGISPHAPYSVSESLFHRMNERSIRDGIPLHIHLAETIEETRALAGEIDWISPVRNEPLQWNPPRIRPVPFMHDLGLLRPGVVFIHCVQLTGDDIRWIARSGVGVVSCPRSNAFLRTGTTPLRQLLDAGARVGLGTDGACSAGAASMLEEMRAAWSAHRRAGPGVSARELVEMATLGGATALGWSHEIGSISPGKMADLTVVALDSLSTRGCDDPYDALVLCAQAGDVMATLVGGTPLHDPHSLFASSYPDARPL